MEPNNFYLATDIDDGHKILFYLVKYNAELNIVTGYPLTATQSALLMMRFDITYYDTQIVSFPELPIFLHTTELYDHLLEMMNTPKDELPLLVGTLKHSLSKIVYEELLNE